MGCIPPNKTPQTTIVAFGAITDIWNVSIYMHIMNINTTALHRKITENGGVNLLISEISGSVLDCHVPHKKCRAYFYRFPPIFRIPWYLLHKHYLKSDHRNLLTAY